MENLEHLAFHLYENTNDPDMKKLGVEKETERKRSIWGGMGENRVFFFRNKCIRDYKGILFC